MRARDLTDLLLLSLLWGAAYLFMRAAVPAFGPAPLVSVRLCIAALMLAPLMLARGGLASLWAHPVPLMVVGVPFTALPFLLLAFASLHITAGLVAVLNATAPMFAALVGHYLLKDRLTGWRLAGLVIGFAGVAGLVWGSASFKSADGLLAVAAVLVTSVVWGLGAQYTRSRLSGVDPLVITVGSLAAGGLTLLPLAWAQWPPQPPSVRAWAEVVFLGVASSGLGFVLYFRLLRRIGPVRAMSVTFLNPVVAMVAGALYLGETVTLQMAVGGAVVLLGTAMSLGLIGDRTTHRDAAR
ncbi:DMT family transporter [Ideonella sp. A 288]|uniref:DMT family transporter n=1 Tax=Ideonella sp. A 288 TaxID=1962181 RepID=UPI000B4AC684|nr:DMT family transporter [Ideonella sp. A 288]